MLAGCAVARCHSSARRRATWEGGNAMSFKRRSGFVGLAGALLLAMLPLGGAVDGLASGEGGLVIKSLSTHADRVSGGGGVLESGNIRASAGGAAGCSDHHG